MKITNRFVMLCTSQLTARADFQRPISERKVRRIAKVFDETRMRPIQVADVDGTLYIWDGQHTAAAARVANGDKDLLVPCIVNKMTYEEAAQHAADQYKNNTRLTPLEIFNAEVEAADPSALNIMRILNKHGITLKTVYRENSTSAINVIKRVCAYSFYDLDETLRLICETWDGDEGRLKGDVINAVHKFCITYRGVYKEKDFIKKVGSKSIDYYIRESKNSLNKVDGAAVTMVRLFVQEYNVRKREETRLDVHAIYEKQKGKKKKK